MLDVSTILLRSCQALVDAAPTLLFGVLLAGFLRAAGRPESIQRLFGGPRTDLSGLVRSSLLATLAPVCSLGVLPVVRELRRAGVPTPKLLSFGLAAPMLNPITIVYGLTVLEWPVFFLIVGVTLLISLGVGFTTSKWTRRMGPLSRPSVSDSDSVGTMVPTYNGWRRMVNVLIASARIAGGRALADVLLALLAFGVVASLLPGGFLSGHLHYTNSMAPLWMMLIAPGCYIAPATGVMQVSAIADVQFSLGAAVVLHVFGVGMNLALVVWMSRLYGGRRLLSLALVVMAVTLGVGYMADIVLPHPPGAEVDTHALDQLERPYHPLEGGLFVALGQNLSPLRAQTPPQFLAALGLFAVLVAAGLLLRVAGVERLQAPKRIGSAPSSGTNLFSRPIPKPWLVGVAAAAVVALLVQATYVYYPPTLELFEEMDKVRADTFVPLNKGVSELAIRELNRWDSLAAKLPMAAALRRRPTSEEAERTLTELRRSIDKARSVVASGSTEERHQCVRQLMDDYARCKAAFSAEQPSAPMNR